MSWISLSQSSNNSTLNKLSDDGSNLYFNGVKVGSSNGSTLTNQLTK